MEYYVILFAGIIIGQTFTAAFLSYIIQKKNEKITYWKSLGIYLKKEFGSFMVVITLTAILLFILPDWFDLRVSREELRMRGMLTKWEQAQTKWRTISIGYGVFAQVIAFVFYKGGRNAILNYGKSKGFDTGDNGQDVLPDAGDEKDI